MRKKVQLDYAYNNPELLISCLDLLCGDFIGSGIARDVYVYAMNSNYVVKIDNSDDSGHNFNEYNVWTNVVNQPKYAKWFAPILWSSSDHRIIVQKKTKPITQLPKELPSFFTDLKLDNFGKIGSQFVCHDYAFTSDLLISKGFNSRMKKVK
tara:strand:- start:213 stop:668 length:456 start_codon:yes stop_codon:yes gene_type:complete